MRPRELTVEGFRSHRDRVTFDFRDRRLIGIVGPIGSGKSSLLDAVVFALYGKTPTFERDTRSLIHQLAELARVQLVFEVDGQVWRATRAIKKRGQSQHKLERLDPDDPDGPAMITVVQERPVRERVEQLLGLDFAAFCRSVMLAQGRFAEFLAATPRERTDVLKGVFGYERFDAALGAARERSATAEGELSILSEEGARIAAARADLEVARADAETAAVRHHELVRAAERIASLTADVRAAQDRAREAQTRATQVASLVRGLPAGADVVATMERADVADAGVQEATDALTAASGKLAEATATLAAIAERVGDHEAVADVADLVARLERDVQAAGSADATATEATEALERAERELHERQAEHAAAADDEDACAAAAAAAAATTAEAEAAVHEARHAEMAAELRRGLTAGKPCPVCSQVVAALPRPARAPKVEAAERALTEARRAEDVARARHAGSSQAVAAAAARVSDADEAIPRRREQAEAAGAVRAAAEAAVVATKSELVDRLGEGDPRSLLEARRRELDEAERAVDRARDEERAARERLEEARSARGEIDARLEAVRDTVLTAWGRLGEDVTVPNDAPGLLGAFVALGERLSTDLERAHLDATNAEEATNLLTGTLIGELELIGLGPDDDVARAVGEAQGNHSAAAQRVAALEEVLARGSDLEVRLADAVARRDLAKRLVADLQPSRFLGFVLEEERRTLAELGSWHLEDLTDGSYRFTDDDRFDIVDVNAAATERSADSLSGGETFLASLALALALAEMVARGGGRLDSFFLDEGFGSLDPEHLDRAMDGIARLVAGDTHRLVVLVSHVEQMRQTLEDLIVLDKDPRTGDTIVVSGASASA